MEEILASIRRIIADDQDRVLPARFATMPARPLGARSFAAPVDEREEDEGDEPVAADAGAPVSAPVEAAAAAPAEPTFAEAEPPAAAVAEAMTEPAAQPEPSAPSEPALPVAADRIEPSAPPEPDPFEPGPSEALISPPADAAAGLAFQRLAATVRPRPALTMEEHVTEMLRPMLRAWLDENLPPLVERLVQAEIERISRRG